MPTQIWKLREKVIYDRPFRNFDITGIQIKFIDNLFPIVAVVT